MFVVEVEEAIAQGRFRGESYAIGKQKYRFFPFKKIRETFGGTLFVNASSSVARTTNERIFH